MTDIRGIHCEISKPKLYDRDGYYYQPLSVNDAYLEYLKRSGASRPQAPGFGANTSSAPLALLDDSSFSGGLPGCLAALLSGVPLNPDNSLQRNGDGRALR